MSDEAKNAAKTYRDKVNDSTDPLMRVLKDIGGAAADAGNAVFDRFRRRRRALSRLTVATGESTGRSRRRPHLGGTVAEERPGSTGQGGG